MSKPKIKLLATDIDGTILGWDRKFSNRMKSALQAVQEKGIKVTLATGRMFKGAEPIAKQFGIIGPLICYQGAMIRDCADDNKIIWSKCVQPHIVKDLIQELRERKLHINLYTGDSLVVEDENEHIKEYVKGRFVNYEVVKSLDATEYNSVYKLLCISHDPKTIIQVKQELENKYKNELCIVKSTPYFCEFTNTEATKGNALKHLAKMWNISQDEIMAAGDEENDIELLKAAKIKVAMEDAAPELKKHANYICGTVKNDGLAEAIERFIL